MQLTSYTFLSTFVLFTITILAGQADIISKGYLTIQYADEVKGNITLGLYDSTTPKTVANFKALLTNNNPETGLINSTSNRIISGFMAQFGFLNGERLANYHIYQDEYPNPMGFPDEKGGLELIHNKYQLSMANRGKNTNSCQFFITFEETPWLNGGYVVFGEVIGGFEIVDFLNSDVKTNRGDQPLTEVKVIACGLLDDNEIISELDEL